MCATVQLQLQVQHPDGSTKAFELTDYDTFLLGRMDYCHLCLPNDERVSRHRFLLEACPLQSSLRDLGSMNDTHVKPQILLSRAQADTRVIAQFKREMDVIAKPRHPNTREVEGFRGWNPLRFWRRSDLIRERGGSGLSALS